MYSKLTFFYKTVNGLLPNYLQSCIESFSQDSQNCIPSRTKTFSNNCFPYCIDKWNKFIQRLVTQNPCIDLKSQSELKN